MSLDLNNWALDDFAAIFTGMLKYIFSLDATRIVDGVRRMDEAK